MKKRGIIIVLLGTMMILNTAFASLPQEFFQHRWRTTPLIGISGGYAVRDGHITSSILYGNNPDTSATLVRDYSDNGLIYGILVGFQGFLHPWLLGIEVNLEWQDIDSPHAYAFSDIHGQFGWNASIIVFPIEFYASLSSSFRNSHVLKVHSCYSKTRRLA
jgi:hypothetical protein